VPPPPSLLCTSPAGAGVKPVRSAGGKCTRSLRTVGVTAVTWTALSPTPPRDQLQRALSATQLTAVLRRQIAGDMQATIERESGVRPGGGGGPSCALGVAGCPWWAQGVEEPGRSAGEWPHWPALHRSLDAGVHPGARRSRLPCGCIELSVHYHTTPVWFSRQPLCR
jgi:hypothetical protein